MLHRSIMFTRISNGTPVFPCDGIEPCCRNTLLRNNRCLCLILMSFPSNCWRRTSRRVSVLYLLSLSNAPVCCPPPPPRFCAGLVHHNATSNITMGDTTYILWYITSLFFIVKHQSIRLTQWCSGMDVLLFVVIIYVGSNLANTYYRFTPLAALLAVSQAGPR